MKDEQIEQLLAQQQVIIEKFAKNKEKDRWDKLATLSPFISTFVIGAIGIYFTATFKAREVRIAEAQVNTAEADVIGKLMPALSSNNENAKKGALLLISTLSRKDLAPKLGAFYASEGIIEALDTLFSKADGDNKELLRDALIEANFSRVSKDYENDTSYTQIIGDCARIFELKSPAELKSKDDGYFLADCYRFRGYANYMRGEYARAEDDYKESLRIKPDYYQIYWTQGIGYLNSKNNQPEALPRALGSLNLAIKNGAGPGIFADRGDAYLELNQLDQALRDYSQYAASFPYEYRGYWGSGLVYKKKAEIAGLNPATVTDFYRKALENLKKAQQFGGSQSDVSQNSSITQIAQEMEEVEQRLKESEAKSSLPALASAKESHHAPASRKVFATKRHSRHTSFSR